MTISLAISPCPNDTFTFWGWLSGKTPGPSISTQFADISELNRLALAGAVDICKISCALLPAISSNYQLLAAGAALGYGCGPKIIANRPFSLSELPQKRIAIPGIHTTAFAVLKRLCPQPLDIVPMRYDLICEAIASGSVDCGLIIHESRFTYQLLGLVEIADLGELWEKTLHLPLPLGCLVAKKKLDPAPIEAAIQASLSYARVHPEEALAFCSPYAQDKDPAVMQAHIDLYVTEESHSLSPLGRRAIAELTK